MPPSNRFTVSVFLAFYLCMTLIRLIRYQYTSYAYPMDELTAKRKMGEEIVRLRKAAGLSQQQFATMLGMNRTRLREIEKGTGNPRLSTLIRIANGLGVELKDLVDFEA